MEIPGYPLRKFILLSSKSENSYHLKAPCILLSFKLHVTLIQEESAFSFVFPKRLNAENEVKPGTRFQRSQILSAKPALNTEQHISFKQFSIPNPMHIKCYGMYKRLMDFQ